MSARRKTEQGTGGRIETPASPASAFSLPGTFSLIRDAEEFRQAAVHIFGAHGWIRQVSKCLGVNETTIWRWVSESGDVKPYALAAMSAWLHVFRLTGERPPHVE